MDIMDNRRNRSKGWFLTYPQCSLAKEDLLDALKAKVDVVEYVVASELHQDGNPHLHAFIALRGQLLWNAKKHPDFWDVDGHHPNVQIARSWKCCIAYCKKDGDYITNIDLDAARSKKAAHNAKLLELDPKKAVDEGYIGLCALPMLLNAKRAYANLEEVPLHLERKCFWIYGKARVGKSHACRDAYPELFEKAQNKWWDSYQGETAVLLDDFDKNGACLGHYLKIWADNYRFNAEVKGGTIRPCYTVLLVTSNYTPDQIFTEDKELCEAVTARFKVIKLENRAGQEELIRKIRPENN